MTVHTWSARRGGSGQRFFASDLPQANRCRWQAWVAAQHAAGLCPRVVWLVRRCAAPEDLAVILGRPTATHTGGHDLLGFVPEEPA